MIRDALRISVRPFKRPPAAATALMRQRAKTFSLAARLLPAEQRAVVTVLYAFCRQIDDLADEPSLGLDVSERLDRLARWRSWLQTDGASKPPATLELPEDVLSVFATYNVPRLYAGWLLDGAEADLRGEAPSDFGALRKYSMRVAGSVGLMLAHVLGATAPAALSAAACLGVAMQLTNIVRDVGEDLRLGRIYLPTDELASAGLTRTVLERLMDTGAADAHLTGVIANQISRSRAFYDLGIPGITALPKGFQCPILAAATMYRSILNQVERNGYAVLTKRATVPMSLKLWEIAQADLTLRFNRPLLRSAPPVPELSEVLSWLD